MIASFTDQILSFLLVILIFIKKNICIKSPIGNTALKMFLIQILKESKLQGENIYIMYVNTVCFVHFSQWEK